MSYGKLSRTLIWLISIGILMDGIGVTSTYFEYRLLHSIASGNIPENFEIVAARNDTRQLWVGGAQIVIYVVSCILALRWLYVSNRILRDDFGRTLYASPGWTVGWFFVPIMNLWKPYFSVASIWFESAHGPDDDSEKTPKILWIWWGLFLIAWWLGRVSFRYATRAEELDELLTSDLLSIASDAVSIAGGASFLALVMLISRNIGGMLSARAPAQPAAAVAA